MENPISSNDTISSQMDPLDDQNQPFVRISVSNRENDSNALRSGRSSNCLRCGYFMDRSKAIFLMVQSPFKEHPSKIRISVNEGAPCTKCTLPDGEVCKALKPENGIDSESFNPNSLRSDKFEKEGKGDEFQENSSTLFPPCTDCHLTLLCDEESKENGSLDAITLMLEIPSSTKEEQEDHKLMTPKSEAGEAMSSEYLPQSMENIEREVIVKETGSEQSVSGAGRYASIPEMNPETEAAYRSHLENLVPCSHCKRTFNPDRIMVHENVCVERAKKRVTKIH